MKKILSAFIVCLLAAVSLHAEDVLDGTGTIKGKITTADGQLAEDVTISVRGTGKGAITNAEGNFVIKNLPAAAYELEISLLGYQTIYEKVNLANNETRIISIQLQLTQQQLKEVVVLSRKQFFKTASDFVAKMPLKNLENAQVYNVVSKELLKEQMIFSVDDATKNAPGLQKMWDATARSGDGGAYYNSRGFIMQSQFRNGVAGNISSRIDAVNLENLEIIKGPSATLFGSTMSSYGGLVNRVTKKPYAKFGGEVAYSTGSYGFNRISADVNTPLNAAKDLLFRLNTAYTTENSFQDNGWEKGYAVAPSLTYHLNDKLSFQFDAEFYSGANTSKQMIFFYFPADQLNAHNPRELGIDYKRAYSSNDIFQNYNNYSLFGQMKYKMSAQWVSETNITTASSFSDGPYAYYYVVPNSVATGVPTATGADYLRRADQSTAANTDVMTEIQQNFIGDFKIGSLRNRFVGGLDFFSHNSNQLFYGADFDLIRKNGVIPEYSNFNKHNLDQVLQDPSKVWNYPYFFSNKTYSAYVSDVLNITDRLIASAALRVDHFDNLGNFDKSSGEYSGGYKQTAFSPKFGLVYQPVKDKVSLFVNYQNGFTNKTGADFDGNVFKPEHANQVEGGVKLNAFQGKLSGTISYYNIQVNDLVRSDPAHATFSIQDGTQQSKGFEAELIANPIDGLNIIGGFSYNDSKMTRADADVEGRRPATAMSPTTANFWVSYRLPFGSWQGLGFGFGGNYASDNKILNSVYYGEFVLPAYTVLNATVFYEQPKFRVGLKADNLTNKEYWIGYGTMNAQKLRSVTASIAFKF
jgi:iron complex outermembrane receptor protein